MVRHEVSASWGDYFPSDCDDPAIVVMNRNAAGSDIIGGEPTSPPLDWVNY